MRRAMLAALLAAVMPAFAHADDAADAEPAPVPVVRTLVLQPMPEPPVLAIEPRDDSDENLRLRDIMSARLIERHGQVRAAAPLVLRFSLTVISGRDTPRDGPGNRFGRFGGGRAPPNAIPRDTPVSYRLSATVAQRDGTLLWRGDVTAPIGDRDEAELTAQLAASLIDHLGRAVDIRLPVDPPRDPGR